MSMKIYLAGPMRNFPNHHETFAFAAARLREQGHEVFVPPENKEEIHRMAHERDMSSIRMAFKLDTAWICDHAEAVALLPDWEKSSGARAEFALAEAIGLTTIKLGKEYVQ